MMFVCAKEKVQTLDICRMNVVARSVFIRNDDITSKILLPVAVAITLVFFYADQKSNLI
jgi:hypothetical protein